MKTITFRCKFCDHLTTKPAKEAARRAKEGKKLEFCSKACFAAYKQKNLSDTWQAWHFRARYKFIVSMKKPLICASCGKLDKHNEVDHIDGNYKNIADDNLQCLCTVCHNTKHHGNLFETRKMQALGLIPV